MIISEKAKCFLVLKDSNDLSNFGSISPQLTKFIERLQIKGGAWARKYLEIAKYLPLAICPKYANKAMCFDLKIENSHKVIFKYE